MPVRVEQRVTMVRDHTHLLQEARAAPGDRPARPVDGQLIRPPFGHEKMKATDLLTDAGELLVEVLSPGALQSDPPEHVSPPAADRAGQPPPRGRSSARAPSVCAGLGSLYPRGWRLRLPIVDRMVSVWYRCLMALTLRTDEELERALTALAESEGLSRQEIIRRAVIERYERAGHRARLDDSAQRMVDRWSDVLDRLGSV